MEKKTKEEVALEKKPAEGGGGFCKKYGATIILVVLVMYVILLGIGTFAEVFNIQSILDWWIWRP
ncbi:MAG: hypothetical protein ABSA46_18605 [Thermodesulfovibrionales bacterium]|jgi:hypothetical protein